MVDGNGAGEKDGDEQYDNNMTAGCYISLNQSVELSCCLGVFGVACG